MRSFQLIYGLALVCGLSAIARADDDVKLPAAGKSVSIEVLIANFSTATDAEKGTPTAEQIFELAKQGKLASSTRVQLATLDMQTASVQYGETVPVATGATIRGGGGPPAVNYRYTETGTTIEAIPRVEEDGSVVLQISVQETRLVPGTKAEKEEAGGFTPTKTAMMIAKTTLRVPAGKSVVTGAQRSDKDASQTWIVISAKVLGAK